MRMAQWQGLRVTMHTRNAEQMCAPIKPKILCDCQMNIIWVKVFHFWFG